MCHSFLGFKQLLIPWPCCSVSKLFCIVVIIDCIRHGEAVAGVWYDGASLPSGPDGLFVKKEMDLDK